MSYVEGDRFLYLETLLGENKLLLQSFRGKEGLNQLFDFQLELLAENATTVGFDSLIGKKVNFGVRGNEKDLGIRHFNGIVVELSQGSHDREFTAYRMRVVPDIWKLTRTFQSRIFQHQTVPDILKQILGAFDINNQIQGDFEPRDYCTQYRETDFNFISRLMEEEGIYYFFKFTQGAHTLVLGNTPQSHPDIPAADPSLIFEEVRGGNRAEERVLAWRKKQSWGSGKYTTWDHHFQLPHQKLPGQTTSAITVPLGTVTHDLNLASNDTLEIFDYPAAYAKRFDGISKSGGEQSSELQKISPDAKRSVGIWMQEQESAMLVVEAASNCRHITSGHKFTLQRHFTGNGKYVITQVWHDANEGDVRAAQNAGRSYYSNQFEGIPYALPFRPPRLSPRPVISGPQTAVVTGPSGEEIFTDKYGRIKVQFHWDRDGKYDGDSSCWLRVGTMWAGKHWGSIHIPRIGHEVIVGFIEGDPDRPVCIGSVYNADTMPSYTLPDNKTRSGIKSDSSMGSGGFNEIRFEDLKGSEQIFINAERNQDIRVKNDLMENIGANSNRIVETDHMEEIKGDKHLSVKGDQNEKVDGTVSMKAGMNHETKVSLNHAIDAGMEIHLKSGLNFVAEAGATLTIKVGGSFINLNPAGVFISGPMVMINSGGAAGSGSGASPSPPKPPVEADKSVPGEMAQIQAPPPPRPPPPKPASASPAATVLTNAAQSGAPFCEICERAAQAQAQGGNS